MDLLGLVDRVALVTGGGNGIARAACLQLAEAGCDVAVVDLDGDAAQDTAREVRARGREATALCFDLMDAEAPGAMVAAAVADLGPISVAINVCGGTGGVSRPILDMTVDDWDRPMRLNLVSTLLSCQAEAISMVEHGMSGAIVNVASSSGVTAAPNLAAYGAANAGVIHLTKTAAIELAPYDIRVNCVVPGTHWTKGTRANASNPDAPPAVRDFFATAERVTPLGRLGEAEETAGVAVFLASRLSSYMTGHDVVSDGGILHTTARPAFGGHTTPDAIAAHLARRAEQKEQGS